MAIRLKKMGLIFWLRAGFLTLISTILLIGFFAATTIRDQAKNTRQVVEDQKVLAKNLITSKEKMDLAAGQMGNIREAVSALNAMGAKNSSAMAEVGNRNNKNVENMQMIVTTIGDFVQHKEPVIRDLNDMEVLVGDALVEMHALVGGYKKEADQLLEQLDSLFTFIGRLQKGITESEAGRISKRLQSWEGSMRESWKISRV